MRTDDIERYLTRQMDEEERTAFEQEMRDQPQLAEDVKIVAWTIEAIRERGQKEDAERIVRMRKQMGNDSKRYTAAVAAVIGGVLVVAAMTAVSIPPIYKHVIKPVIESVFGSKDKMEQVTPQQAPPAVSIDSLANNGETDSIGSADNEENAGIEETPKREDVAEEEATDKQDAKEEPTQPMVKVEEDPDPQREEKTEEVKTSNKASNLDIRQMVENTEYHLTKIDYDNKGNLVAYMTLLNNKENIDFDLSQMPIINIDGNERTAYRVTVDGATTQSFKLRKRQPVNLVIYFNGVKTGASTINLLQVKNANSYKSLQLKKIPIN